MLQINHNIEYQNEVNHNSHFIEGTTNVSDDTSHHESSHENDSDQNINAENDGIEDEDHSKKKTGLRKGKWTTEEERYTNKVIESFNAGTLKLSENERGITLRAYLADKLGCDPMRITKKYTGASCLGKRVYHAHKQSAKPEEIERVTLELSILEQNFRQKLQQMNRTRNGINNLDSNSNIISTPAIDALFNSNINNFPPSAWNQLLSNKMHNVNNYLYPMPISSGYPPNYPMPPYRSISNNEQQQYMQAFASNYHYYFKAAAAENGFLQYEKNERSNSYGGEGSLSSGQTGTTTKASENHHTNIAQNSINEFYQNQNDRNFMSYPPIGMKATVDFNAIPTNSRGIQQQFPKEIPPLIIIGSNHSIQMNNPSIHLEQLTEEESSNDEDISNEDQDQKHAAIPIITNENHSEFIKYSNTNYNNHHELNNHLMNIKPTPSSPKLNKKVKISERDSEAASSLLGFFTQLERNNSQEDLVDFLEDVQKTAVASTTPKSTTSVSSGIIPTSQSVTIPVAVGTQIITESTVVSSTTENIIQEIVPTIMCVEKI